MSGLGKFVHFLKQMFVFPFLPFVVLFSSCLTNCFPCTWFSRQSQIPVNRYARYLKLSQDGPFWSFTFYKEGFWSWGPLHTFVGHVGLARQEQKLAPAFQIILLLLHKSWANLPLVRFIYWELSKMLFYAIVLMTLIDTDDVAWYDILAGLWICSYMLENFR